MLKLTHLFPKNDKYITFHNKCLKIPPNLNLNALRNSCTKFACCSSELIFTFLCAGSSIQNASEQFVSCISLSFVNVAVYTTPQTKI